MDGSRQVVAGRYRLRHLLGRGGMGRVWLAEDEILRRHVAIKEFMLPAEALEDAAATARALCEARAAARVAHPGVVAVHDVAFDGDELWIVMEALSGQTLATVIREQGRLAQAQVVEIGLQLVEALRAVHREGLVHRDVKPGNVHLGEDGRAVLIDFGLAFEGRHARPIKPGRIVGSPPFMAPESIREGMFSPASDLFSLGATLYAAVEGRHPFTDLSAFSTLEAIADEDFPESEHAGCLWPVILGMLSKDPKTRLNAAAARDRLKAIQAEFLSQRDVSVGATT
jgi:eukaryotic-like serine/threonine-protein kinase